MGWQEWQGYRKSYNSIGEAENTPQNTPQNANRPMAFSHVVSPVSFAGGVR
jgi:hypothetical protein